MKKDKNLINQISTNGLIHKIRNNTWFWIGIAFVIMVVGHLVIIQIWDQTSSVIKPANALELEVKTPVEVDDWLVRRGNGVCPFDANDFDISDPGKGFTDC